MKIFKFKRRFIALLLCMTMMLGLMPGTANALELTTTDEGLSISADSGSSEVVALREENIKHFDMGNGIFQAVAYSHPVHKLDSDGNWQDIDFGLTLTGTRSSRMYANEEAGAAFAENYVANQPIMTLSDEENAISMSLITTNVNNTARLNTNTAVAAEVTNPQNSFQTIEDAKNADFSSKILYEEVLPGVDLEYIVDPGTVKENIIVNEKATAYQYSFALNLTGLYPIMQDDGSIIVYDQDADTKEYEIPAPFMYDALGNVSEDVAYALTGSGNTYTLTVTANADWINTEGRNFPITIDPTYVISTEDAYDTYIDEDSPDVAHGSNSMLWVRSNRVSYIRVPTPSVPTYASVDWAELVAYYYYFDYVTSGQVNVSAHRVTGGSWNENTLTWNSISNVSNYGLSTAALDTVTAAAGNATASSPAQAKFAITNTFKNWVNGTNSNYGIGLKYATGSTNHSVVFKSFEASYTYRPRITYQYVVAGGEHTHTYTATGSASVSHPHATNYTCECGASQTKYSLNVSCSTCRANERIATKTETESKLFSYIVDENNIGIPFVVSINCHVKYTNYYDYPVSMLYNYPPFATFGSTIEAYADLSSTYPPVICTAGKAVTYYTSSGTELWTQSMQWNGENLSIPANLSIVYTLSAKPSYTTTGAVFAMLEAADAYSINVTTYFD